MLRVGPTRVLRAVGTVPPRDYGMDKAIFALVDQGFFAGSNFVVNILLARWLSPEAYGTFAIAYSVFLLLGTFHTAALTAPLLVFGAARYAREFRRYLGLLVLGHIAMTTIMSLILAVAAATSWSLGMAALAEALLGLAVAAPFILLLWLARPACYACFRPQWAAAGGVLHLGILTAVMYALQRAHALSPAWALIVMGATSLVVGSGLLSLLQPQWRSRSGRSIRSEVGESFSLLGLGFSSDAGDNHTGRRESDFQPAAIRDHSRFARWSLATAVMSWVGANLQYFLLTVTTSLASVATMRILDTMLLPFWHVQVALSRLLIPALGARTKGPHTELVPFAVRMLVVWAALGIFAYALVRSLGAPVIAALYGRPYSQYAYLLAWYGLILIPEMVGEAAFALFRAVVRMDLVFVYQLLFSIGVLLGFLGVARHGLPGIISARIGVTYVLWPFVMLSVRGVCVRARASLATELQ